MSKDEFVQFESDHFRSIWFENVRVFEHDDGVGWRCLDDENGRIGDGPTPEAAIAAMFGGAPCVHEREGHSYLPLTEFRRLRDIEDAAQAVVDFWEDPTAEELFERQAGYTDEIAREIEHLRLALEPTSGLDIWVGR